MLKLLQITMNNAKFKIQLGVCLLVALFIVNSTGSQAAETSPQDSSIDELSIELSDQAQKAINNGVLLTIDCEFATIQSWLFIDRAMNTKKHQFTLSRHTLSNRYIVKRDDFATPHMFRSIPEATDYITKQALVLLESYTTYDTQRKMRISLNKFELPGPMRLEAFLLNKWDLDTGWLAWEFDN